MGRQGERATCGKRSSLHGIDYLEDDSDDVSKPNAHISPPSKRDTVTYVEKQGVVSVSKRDMDGTMSRFEHHVSPCKQKNVTVSRFDPPNTLLRS